MMLRDVIRRFVPLGVRRLIGRGKRLFVYSNYDSSEYWKRRAAEPGQAAVLWRNREYNELYRADQRQVMEPWITQLQPSARILDIGCGIGIVSRMILDQRTDVTIDAVDFDEMVAVARATLAHPSIRYIAAAAETYRSETEHYDLIISSASYSAIRDINKLQRALSNGAAMLKKGGIMLMIDPFHRWVYLARARYSTRDVIRYLRPRGLTLVEKSGVLFWPFREWLADSELSGETLTRTYLLGERIGRVLGRHFWADYKILTFRKSS